MSCHLKAAMQGGTVKIDAVADINSLLTKYLSGIRECDHGIHVLVQTIAE